MDFHALTSLDEALEKLADYGSDATLVAGGTSARYLIMSGQITAKAVLHIERLAIGSHGGLSGITLNGGARLGALANLRDIAEQPEIISRFNGLATAAGKCGGWQTQSTQFKNTAFLGCRTFQPGVIVLRCVSMLRHFVCRESEVLIGQYFARKVAINNRQSHQC